MPTDLRVVPAAYVYLLRGEHPVGPGTEVLLQLRRGTGYRDGHWAAAAAGHLDPGETPYAAAVREAAEELGLDGLDLTPLAAMARTGRGDPIDERVDYLFTCRSWRGEPRVVEPEKCAGLRWCRLDTLPEPVVPHEAVVLRLLLAGPVPPLLEHGFDRMSGPGVVNARVRAVTRGA